MSSHDDISKYPPNSRIFIGNLPSEKTSKEELEQIFGKYGRVCEVILRRSFGFIQFDSPEAAIRAIQEEQGRVIGGLKTDLKLATGTPRDSERRSKKRRGKRSRSRSPTPDREYQRRRSEPPSLFSSPHSSSSSFVSPQGGYLLSGPPFLRPQCKILYLSSILGEIAEELSVELTQRSHGLIRSDVVFIGLGYVQEHLTECERQQIRWVVVCRESPPRGGSFKAKSSSTKFDVYTLIPSREWLHYEETRGLTFNEAVSVIMEDVRRRSVAFSTTPLNVPSATSLPTTNTNPLLSSTSPLTSLPSASALLSLLSALSNASTTSGSNIVSSSLPWLNSAAATSAAVPSTSSLPALTPTVPSGATVPTPATASPPLSVDVLSLVSQLLASGQTGGNLPATASNPPANIQSALSLATPLTQSSIDNASTTTPSSVVSPSSTSSDINSKTNALLTLLSGVGNTTPLSSATAPPSVAASSAVTIQQQQSQPSQSPQFNSLQNFLSSVPQSASSSSLTSTNTAESDPQNVLSMVQSLLFKLEHPETTTAPNASSVSISSNNPTQTNQIPSSSHQTSTYSSLFPHSQYS